MRAWAVGTPRPIGGGPIGGGFDDVELSADDAVILEEAALGAEAGDLEEELLDEEDLIPG